MNETQRDIRQGEKGIYAEEGDVYVTYSNDHKIPKHLSTSLPCFPDIFLGRDEDLNAVHEKLFAGDNLLLLVNGEGGIGKTTFAARYWQRYEHEYQHLAWLFTGHSLLDALLTLAPKLGVRFPETMPGEQRLAEMLAVMADLPKPCLLALDNANDVDELKRHYQALHRCSNFHILLTTRITRFANASVYPIKPLPENVALDLFQQHYPRHQPVDDDLFYAIYHAVGGNTLVVEVLAKNLAVINSNETFYPLTELLKDLQQLGLLKLAQQETIPIVGKRSGHSLMTAKPADILMALYDEVEMVRPLTDAEKRLLSNFAVLPAEYIAYPQLKTLLQPDDARAFSAMLTDLAQRGWLECDTQTSGAMHYKISPVVQEIIRYKNQGQLLRNLRPLIHNLIVLLRYEPGTGHLLSVSYQDAAIYARYATTVIATIQEADYFLAALCERIGSYHKTTGDLNLALIFFGQYSHLAKIFSEAEPNNVDFKNRLATSYFKLGDANTALGNLNKALHFYEKNSHLANALYETNHLNKDFKHRLAISYSKLGQTHTALNNLSQALCFYEDCFRLENELHDDNPENVVFKHQLAISCQFLGITYKALGNFEKSFCFFEDSSRLEKELNGHNPENVTFKHGLAVSYHLLGNSHLALGNLQQSLCFYEDHLRLENELYCTYPENVAFKNALAVSYANLGEFYRDQQADNATARHYFEQAFTLWQELTESYPAYAEFSKNFAQVKNALAGL